MSCRELRSSTAPRVTNTASPERFVHNILGVGDTVDVKVPFTLTEQVTLS